MNLVIELLLSLKIRIKNYYPESRTPGIETVTGSCQENKRSKFNIRDPKLGKENIIPRALFNENIIESQ